MFYLDQRSELPAESLKNNPIRQTNYPKTKLGKKRKIGERDVVYKRGRLLSDEDGGGMGGFVFRREESYHVVEKKWKAFNKKRIALDTLDEVEAQEIE
ncbi:hypothetical protein MTR_5g062105 [Medicago truncatula]|uniref:Uncharacterized protein n=1 Tax=Medicago truncatula TaxID=3880 RepID=A0A072UEG8_MEDTR|nr:hypothetical protein MTR_5g062105 [Medicago truncatula]